MRTAAAALAVLLAFGLSAQTVDPNELTYGPFVAGPRDHSFSIGVAPGGLLLAWSEVDPGNPFATIHIGLLDFHAQLVSPIRTLAPDNPTSQATTPVVATDGERFFVAWLERDVSTWQPSRIAGALVDAGGVQRGETLNLGRATAGEPSLVWDGLTFRLFGQTVYYVSADGVPRKGLSAPAPQRVQFATPHANGWVDWSNHRRDLCWFGCPPATSTFEWAVITHEWIRTGSFTDEGSNAARPAVLANADDLLIIWSSDAGLKGLPILDGRAAKQPFALKHDLARPSKNPAAAESLVVYERNGDIYGTVLIDGAKFGDPFPISTGTRWDELPRVYLVGPNRYLVTYVIGRDPAGVHMAGRFVSIQ